MSKNPFDEFSVSTPTDASLDDVVLDEPLGMKVGNKFPTLTGFPYKLAIIGEAPGKDEEVEGIPFVGMSGKLLTGMLAKAGVVREACFIGNVCQYRPFNNNITNLEWDSEAMQEGITMLLADLATFKPNLVFCLGGTSLHLLKAGNVAPPKRKTPKGYVYKFPNPIGKWRGSLFQSHLGYKCLSSYHPAACTRMYQWTAYLWFDIIRCLKEATTPILTLPQRDLKVDLTYEELLYELEQTNAKSEIISVDIEGGIGSMSCCSIANSSGHSFIVPFSNINVSSFWSEEQEIEVWRAFIKVMTNPNVPKILQNGLYDRFVLAYSYHILVRGCIDDTMLKFDEWLCELRKGLAVQASILTTEPYWKGDRLHAEEADADEESE